MKHFFKILYIATKIAVIVTPVILLGWLVKQDLALSGQLEFTYDFSKDSAAITNLFPANRLTPVTCYTFYFLRFDTAYPYLFQKIALSYKKHTIVISRC